MRRLLILIPALLVACDGSDGLGGVSRDAPPAAAMVVPGMETESLSEQLRELETELRAAAEGEAGRVLTAEAITDRLIHAERPVDWLAVGYDVEARLRQLQAMADRVVALLRRGSSIGAVASDIQDMRAAVEDLQEQLARPGGGSAPPTLDSLLAQDPLRDVQSASLRAVVAAQDSADADRELPDIEPSVRPVQTMPPGAGPGATRDTVPRPH